MTRNHPQGSPGNGSAAEKTFLDTFPAAFSGSVKDPVWHEHWHWHLVPVFGLWSEVRGPPGAADSTSALLSILPIYGKERIQAYCTKVYESHHDLPNQSV
ncbi:hypothetical protein HYALB_00012620 [Hymenoscyphus albidus]|uniref:Uncharacterized protein n=1 Tax=Hymenoscyphus albidus TaxID=595503 RepID=A0A9N9LZ30_9HELO|nr:hypothetical protein HYALB_00012620 [Hymenoscyphus albidus]